MGSGSQAAGPQVRITVQDASLPQAGIPVVFQNTDGSVIAEVMTDASGVATADMPNGGNVSVVRTFPQANPPDQTRPAEVYTYVGVKPGDKLVLGDPTSTAAPSAINVKVPDGAQGTVKIVMPCGTGQGTAPTVPVSIDGCPANTVFYVTDQGNSSFLAQAPVSENVDLSSQLLSGQLTASLSATNVPSGATVNAEERVEVGTFALYSSGQKRVDNQSASINVPSIKNADQVVVANVSLPNGGGHAMVATRTAFQPAPTSIDVGTGLPPSVQSSEYSPTGVSWVESGTGSADFVVAVLTIARGDVNGVPPLPADATYIRAIVAPHGGATLAMPALPPDLSTYMPTANDQISGTTALVSMSGGYDAARASLFTLTDLGDLAPSGGRLAVSYDGNSPPAL